MAKKRSIVITKDLFETIIKAIQRQIEVNKNISHAMGGNGYVHFGDELIDILTDILSDGFKLEYNSEVGNDLLYWMYELNFGKRWKKGMVKVNKKDVKLKTIDDLWIFLNKSK